MGSEIAVALITGGCSVAAVVLTVIANSRSMQSKLDKNQAVFEAIVTEKIGTLTEKVEKHNSVISRTYELEKNSELQAAELKRHNERLKELEKGGVRNGAE